MDIEQGLGHFRRERQKALSLASGKYDDAHDA
jgi:hypothetical protein